MSEMLEVVSSYLFAERGAHVYAILDGASVPGLREKLYAYEPQHECLYRGELEPDMAEVAPYLVLLDRKSAFTAWVLTQGWGKHWGIFAVSRASLPDLRKHFRRFLTVHDAGGRPLLFRYYDPRVLRVYLPTCNAEELQAMFGPVLCYILEAENPQELLRLQFDSGKLLPQAKSLNGGQ